MPFTMSTIQEELNQISAISMEEAQYILPSTVDSQPIIKKRTGTSAKAIKAIVVPVKCEICNVDFVNSQVLKSHNLRLHAAPKLSGYECAVLDAVMRITKNYNPNEVEIATIMEVLRMNVEPKLVQNLFKSRFKALSNWAQGIAIINRSEITPNIVYDGIVSSSGLDDYQLEDYQN